MTATKNNSRIHARSPFYITAAPSTGTISSADLTIKLQTGSRYDGVSMTDLKTYALTSTNAIDNRIVFNISPLILDYITRSANRHTSTSPNQASVNECIYVFWDLSVTRTGGTDDSSGYYVGVEGYSKYSEGINWQPVTDATGNYGNPAWTPTTAKGTQRTIMATQCYRQIGQDSFAILPIYMGEFDESYTDWTTFARIAFGDYTDAFTFSGSTNELHDYTILDSDTRAFPARWNMQYIPIGKQNMGANWSSGYDYLTVGHCVNRTETPSGQETATLNFAPSHVDTSPFIVLEPGEKVRLYTSWITGVTLDIAVNDVIETLMEAFNDCGETYPPTSINIRVDAITSTYIDFTVQASAAVRAQVDCFSGSLQEILWSVYFPVVSTSNDIAIVNDNPLIRYEIICEPKYRVVDFFFVNKWGAWDCFSFLKASRETIETTSETFYKSVGGISGGTYTYDVTDNQIQRHNISMKKSYQLNTGYVNESFGLLLEEIMATPRAYMIWDGEVIPVNVKDATQELKQHVNDKLINYTLELEAASDYINNAI